MSGGPVQFQLNPVEKQALKSALNDRARAAALLEEAEKLCVELGREVLRGHGADPELCRLRVVNVNAGIAEVVPVEPDLKILRTSEPPTAAVRERAEAEANG